jgi:DNA-binding Lrp family transcriptional regulator
VGRRPKITKPSTIGHTERRREAVDLRRAGLTFDAIGERMGISGPSAFELVKKALEDFRSDTAEAVEDHRRLELARLERIVEIMWPQVEEGRGDAVDRVLKVAQRKAALLGLDLKTPEAVNNHLHVHATPHPENADPTIMVLLREWATKGGAKPALPSPPEVIDGEASDG